MSQVEWRSRTQKDQLVQSGEWADKHGVFHSLLPYGYRQNDPIDVLTTLRAAYHSFGKYQQSFRLEDIKTKGTPSPNPNQHFTLLHWSGAWAWTGWDSTSAFRYCNPVYTHDSYVALDDFGRRRWLATRTENIPHWTNTKLSHAFGISVRSVQRFLRNHTDIETYTDHKRRDLPTFARTIKTLQSWGYELKTLAQCFPYTASGLASCVSEHARGYNAPINPYE